MFSRSGEQSSFFIAIVQVWGGRGKAESKEQKICVLWGLLLLSGAAPPQITVFKPPPLQRFAARKDDVRDGRAVRESGRRVLQGPLLDRFSVRCP